MDPELTKIDKQVLNKNQRKNEDCLNESKNFFNQSENFPKFLINKNSENLQEQQNGKNIFNKNRNK